MTLYKWSQTASADATADSSINWAEGQAPSSVNDSARAMMAATAKYRDDIAGAIVTSGTSTAYAVSSYQGFDTLAHLNGQMIAFTPHTTNGQTVTLNLDGLGAKPLRSAPNVELPAGTIIQGTPYVAVYNSSDGAFYLQGFFGNPYSIPVGAGLDYWGSATPNSSFAFPAGQAISRTTYATLFAIFSTQYGAGDGTTTFNLPDKRGRVSAALDNMGGTYATRLTASGIGFGAQGQSPTALGAAGGSESATAPLPVHSHGVTDPGHAHTVSPNGEISPNSAPIGVVVGVNPQGSPFTMTSTANVTGISIQNSGAGGAHQSVQPTIVCNYILRII